MYLSDIKPTKKTVMAYVCITALCAVFSVVYNMNSHGEHSPYMTFLCLWPLLLGAILFSVLMLVGKKVRRLSYLFWNSGVALLCVGSALKGIFDIAKTSSGYLSLFFILGALFLLSAACMAIFRK